MAALKSVLSLVLLTILITVVLQSKVIESQGQTCSASPGNLNMCAPFVLPGTSNPGPSEDCCSALQSLDHECICNTLRVAARLPSRCNLSPIACARH
ncbi:Stamen-specific protein FIL1 [Capsicum annuum]|uniref:Stamen-specific protein FIL1 n=1 Tax=Capsicum annuum TaxID=4072 RepID=A0A2G2Z8N6_CAPAN|nr:Stamen-specific protein FIL1 [Capsicum annuum]KAF3659957.1 Stamen-specific protein FIL1 [Capsicum annuum]PHT78367.1 Stamen-specific protein FIL1 [Capsicum annuum]